MANKVVLDPAGFIYQELKQDMTPYDLREDIVLIRQYEKQLEAQGKPIRVLVNANGIAKASIEMRQVGVENLKKMSYDRLAVTGLPNQYMAKMVNFVLIASGKAGKIKIFPDNTSARAWLAN